MKKHFYLLKRIMFYDSYEQDDPLNQPNPKDKDTENPDTIKKRKSGRPKNNVWNLADLTDHLAYNCHKTLFFLVNRNAFLLK